MLDQAEFAALFDRHRGELRVHCYRMLGALDEAEDLVQETFLRAWKHLASFEGRASMRAWLYRIATNACLDALATRTRRVLPYQLAADEPAAEVRWLQPLPDRVLEHAAPREHEPDALIVTRESIELAFLTSIQQLPPLQRAVLILRDVLGWSAQETGAALDTSVASVNSALQRARATLDTNRSRTTRRPAPSDDERAVLRRYMAAVEAADLDGLAALLADDVRATMPPLLQWFDGREQVMAALAASWNPSRPDYVGRFKMIETSANRMPAAAAYVRKPADSEFHAFAIGVVGVSDGRIVELTAFHDVALFASFGLPPTLPIDR